MKPYKCNCFAHWTWKLTIFRHTLPNHCKISSWSMEHRQIPYTRTEQRGNYLLPNQMTNKTPVIKPKNGQNSCNQTKELRSNPVIKLNGWPYSCHQATWLAQNSCHQPNGMHQFLPLNQMTSSIFAMRPSDCLNSCHQTKWLRHFLPSNQMTASIPAIELKSADLMHSTL